MSESEYLLSQADIFKDLLEGTIQGSASGKRLKHTEIVAGANATIMTFRNFGGGLPLESAEALEDLASFEACPYHLKPLTHLHSFELQWFLDGFCTAFHYSRGIQLSRETVANEAPDGLLLRLGWHDKELEKKPVLSTEAVKDVTQMALSPYSLAEEIVIWFNGERISH